MSMQMGNRIERQLIRQIASLQKTPEDAELAIAQRMKERSNVTARHVTSNLEVSAQHRPAMPFQREITHLGAHLRNFGMYRLAARVLHGENAQAHTASFQRDDLVQHKGLREAR